VDKLTGKIAVTALVLGVAASAVAGVSLPALAEDEAKIVLTPEELAEKESRKACKIQICRVFRNKKTSGEKISCAIKKTWREKAIKEMVSGGKIGWRWGAAVCHFDLNLMQADLQKAVSLPEYELKIPSHLIKCEVDRKKDGAKYNISVGLSPTVKFKDGKAVAGRMNWGKVEAPLLVKGLIWPGVKLDNGANILGGKLAKMVNGFMTKKCDQVKDAL